ncbi:hypothetical protein [Ensifer sp. B1-9]|uniref:hypothetical protein n=1 Tax=Ensifer sp. B1-9 TaxID=3141455 RepID=UPI003D1C9DED
MTQLAGATTVCTPDRLIKQVGDTVEPYYQLVVMRDIWEHGMPLSDSAIACVEAITPPGCFS